jgi:circadian clock protein KaiB
MTGSGDASETPIELGGAAPEEVRWEFTLFVSGASDRSARAIAEAQALCDLHLPGRYQLAVVDLHGDDAIVHASHVVATPTLIRHAPLPERRCVGDLSRPESVRALLDLPVPEAVHHVPG